MNRRRRLDLATTVLELVGAAALLAGVFMLSVAVGLIVAGSLAIFAGIRLS